jgi:hypothetical protein
MLVFKLVQKDCALAGFTVFAEFFEVIAAGSKKQEAGSRKQEYRI